MRYRLLIVAVLIAMAAVQGRAQSTNPHALVEHYATLYHSSQSSSPQSSMSSLIGMRVLFLTKERKASCS
jgi:hypothetical protein